MKIVCKVNAEAAIISGINFGSITVDVEVNPGDLTLDQRRALVQKKNSQPVIDSPDVEGLVKFLDQHAKTMAAEAEKRIEKIVEFNRDPLSWSMFQGIELDELTIESQDIIRRDGESKEKVAREKKANRQAVLDKEKEESDKRKAALKLEYDALYARLSVEMRNRDAAGFAGRREIKLAISSIIREDSGTSYVDLHREQFVAIDVLTDDEFSQFLAVLARVPKGAKLDPCTGYNGGGYRPADDEDDDDDIDSDREVSCPREDVIRGIRAKWSRGGVEAIVFVEFDK